MNNLWDTCQPSHIILLKGSIFHKGLQLWKSNDGPDCELGCLNDPLSIRN
jgi:hypothetical protein